MKTERKINLNMFGIIYFVIFAVSIVFNEESAYLKFPKQDEFFLKNMGIDIGIGLGIGLIIVILCWVLTKYTKMFQEFIKTFNALLGPLSIVEIFFISVFSSLAEEFFFRGMIQAKLGIVLASFMFGALHTGPGKKYIPWTVFAIVMGFVLGGLYEWKDDLMLPVTIHFVVNFLNLYLMQKMPKSQAPVEV